MLETLENTIKYLGLEIRPAVLEHRAESEGWLLSVATSQYELNGPEPAPSADTVQKVMDNIQRDLAVELSKQCERQPGKYTQVTEITVNHEDGRVWGFVYLK